MSDIKRWSTTAASNNSPAPDGAPEGTFRFSEINDWMRETHASIRRWYEDAQWIDYGHSLSFVGSSSFKIIGSNQLATYTAGRRLRAMIGTGSIYADILSATFLGGDTSVVLTLDGAALDSSLSSVAVGALTPANSSVPKGLDLWAGARISASALAAQSLSTSALVAASASVSALVANAASISALNAAAASISALRVERLSASAVIIGSVTIAALQSADQSAMEVASRSDLAVTPESMKWHPAHPKAWVTFNGSAAAVIQGSYNIASVSRSAVGVYRINFTTAFSNTNYCMMAGGRPATDSIRNMIVSQDASSLGSKLVGSIKIQSGTTANTTVDGNPIYATFFGDQ